MTRHQEASTSPKKKKSLLSDKVTIFMPDVFIYRNYYFEAKKKQNKNKKCFMTGCVCLFKRPEHTYFSIFASIINNNNTNSPHITTSKM